MSPALPKTMSFSARRLPISGGAGPWALADRAANAGAAAPEERRWLGWQFQWENDAGAILSGSDEHYTNGLRFAMVRNPDESSTEARLFVTVRGDPSVTFFQTTDDARFELTGDELADRAIVFRLDCDAYSVDPEEPLIGGRCGSKARIGDARNDSSRLLALPVEPVSIAASDDGASLAVLHQTSGAASLLINKWNDKAEVLGYVAHA